jgi:HAD superfamily hydrolase (TIGR01490 family)
MAHRPAIAFFDLDRTLIATNSAKGWVKRQVRRGTVGRRQAARAGLWMGLYHLGVADMDRLIRDAVRELEGDDEADLAARSLAFWHEEVVGTIRPGARAALDRHRARGDKLVILTASSPYLGEAARAALDMDAVLSNRFEVRDGRFTGAAIEPLCFGAGKATLAAELAAEHGVDLADCAFYTDSFTDLPAMEAFGEPVAVHPDPRLLRAARKRGWRIETWDAVG